MKKFYKVFLLIIVFTFLSTFNSKDLSLISKKKDNLFNIKNIEVKNNILVDEKEIYKKLQYIYNKNIFFIKKIDIEKPLQKIDFLEKIDVKKKYPNSIIIKVFETTPVANLIKNKKKYLIDSSSALISRKDDTEANELPTVFGEGAENEFIFFYNQLKSLNFPNLKIKNYYYFQIGRWDLKLSNNKIIKLPYTKTNEAIIKVIELLNRQDFKNYKVIDLRVDGKIIVE